MSNIIFFNPNKGNQTYKGDSPYIHWFDGPKSVDLFHSQALYWLSDKETHTIETKDHTNTDNLVVGLYKASAITLPVHDEIYVLGMYASGNHTESMGAYDSDGNIIERMEDNGVYYHRAESSRWHAFIRDDKGYPIPTKKFFSPDDFHLIARGEMPENTKTLSDMPNGFYRLTIYMDDYPGNKTGKFHHWEHYAYNREISPTWDQNKPSFGWILVINGKFITKSWVDYNSGENLQYDTSLSNRASTADRIDLFNRMMAEIGYSGLKISDLHWPGINAELQVAATEIELDWDKFTEIQNPNSGIIAPTITSTGFPVYEKDGVQMYAHSINFISKSIQPGEYVWDFTIDGEPFKAGVEFWEENEALRINAVNMGEELPGLICKALYSTDIYEDNEDTVMMNRKLRELLMNYMELTGSKGSYSSLKNCLDWFEYGDLAELREVWKHETPDGPKYMDVPIRTWLTEEYKNMTANQAKTTSFVLRNLAARHSQPGLEYGAEHQDGTDVYKEIVAGDVESKQITHYLVHDLDNNPVKSIFKNDTDEIACKWSKDEMRLKMVLLGAFFEQYFMPVHTELVRSVVEDIFETPAIKLLRRCTEAHQTDHFENMSDYYENGDPGDDDYTYTGMNDVWSAGDDKIETPASYDFDPANPGPEYRDTEHSAYDDETETGVLHAVECYAGFRAPTGVPNGAYFQIFETSADNAVVTREGPVVDMIACHTLNELKLDKALAINDFSVQNYKGIGCIVKAHLDFNVYDRNGEPVKTHPIKSARISTNLNGYGQSVRWEGNISATSGGASSIIEFKLLFRREGTFRIVMDFVDMSGNTFSRIKTIKIIDGQDPAIRFQKIVRLSADELKNCIHNPFAVDPNGIYNWNSAMFIRNAELNFEPTSDSDYHSVQLTGPYMYSQFIPSVCTYDTMDRDINKPADLPKSDIMITRYVECTSATEVQAKLNTIGHPDPTSYGTDELVTDADGHEYYECVFSSLHYQRATGQVYKEDDVEKYYAGIRYIFFDDEQASAFLAKMETATDGFSTFARRVFVPEFHKMELIKFEERVDNRYPIICQPILSGVWYSESIRYSNEIVEAPSWKFTSVSTGKQIVLPFNTSTPFIGPEWIEEIPRGYLRVELDYRYGNSVHHINQKTPFVLYAGYMGDKHSRTYNRY